MTFRDVDFFKPTPWPPQDAGRLIAVWRELGKPEIEVGPGQVIFDLEKWFGPHLVFRGCFDSQVETLRIELFKARQSERGETKGTENMVEMARNESIDQRVISHGSQDDF